MFGDFRGQLRHVAIIELRPGFLEHRIAKHLHQPLLPVLYALFQSQILFLKIPEVIVDRRGTGASRVAVYDFSPKLILK